jgi:hypothetical protein
VPLVLHDTTNGPRAGATITSASGLAIAQVDIHDFFMLHA